VTQTREQYNAYMRDYLLRRYHERMEEARRRLGGKCARCPSVDDLQLDHKDPKTKSFTIAKLWSVSRERFDTELLKCQLLCPPCHTEKTLEDLGRKRARGTHGTVSSYRYCGPPKCESCKAAKRRCRQDQLERQALVAQPDRAAAL
jgi:hypothetical protein